MQPRIEWTVGLAALRPWAERWNALAANAPQRLPMLSLAWIDAYAKTLMPPGAVLHCALAHDNGQLVGALPLVWRRSGMPLVWVGSASTPYQAHSAFGDVLADPRWAPSVVPALLAAACARPGMRLREFALRGVSSTSPTIRCLLPQRLATVQTLPTTPTMHTTHTRHRSWGSFLAIDAPWSAYRDGLSKNFRANLRKAHNRLRDSGEGAPEFLWLTGERAEPRHLASFLALEASGWKGRAGSAIGQDAPLCAFYQALCENMHRLGVLEWHFMTLRGRTVAAHMAVRTGRSLSLLKIAYDEGLARFSPGNLLFEATVQRACSEAQTDEINCLTDMDWHRPWNMQRREYFDVRVFPATLLGVGLGRAPRALVDAAKFVFDKNTAHRESVRDCEKLT